MKEYQAQDSARSSIGPYKATQLLEIKIPLSTDLNEIIEDKGKQPKDIPQVNYKSFWDFFWISIILAISSFQVGYSLCQTAAVPINVIISQFKIPFGVGLTHGLLLGIWPFGGMFGAMLNSYLVRRWKKRWIMYFIGVVNLISTVLMQITTYETILIGRFLLGVTCGMYPMVVPVMTKELCPPSLKLILGSFYSLARIIGIIFCFSIGLILEIKNIPHYWRIVFVIPGIIVFIQTLLIYFFIPDIPQDLIKRGQVDKVQEMIKKFYLPQFVDSIVKQFQRDYELQKSQSTREDGTQDPYKDNKKRAFLMALHLNMFTQFIGINTITLLSGTLMSTIYPSISLYTNLIINTIRLPPTIIATFWVGKKYGRRTLFLLSGLILGISNYMIVVGYLTNTNVLVITFLYVFMIMFSLLYTPVNYVYVAEITPPQKITIANIFNQAAMAVSLLFPPIIFQKMNGNGYPVFLFFGVYTTISLVYMYKCMVESKGRKYQDIIKDY